MRTFYQDEFDITNDFTYRLQRNGDRISKNGWQIAITRINAILITAVRDVKYKGPMC